jgi:hypothetical protein
MNVPSRRELLQQFEQQQNDHPVGAIAARYVEQLMKKRGVADEKEKPAKRRHTRKGSQMTRTDDPV